jgi:Terminase large subunit, ATPase domain
VTSTARRVRHRSGGPRPDVLAPPLDLSQLGRLRATRAVRFMEGLLVPKGKGARSRLRLRKWQREIVRAVLAPGIRTAVVAIPRGNGKSTLAAALGLWALVDGPEGAQVPIVGGVSERQSRIAFDTARRMVQLDPELLARVQAFQDKLYMPHHDATLYPLPADADAILGANPTMTIVDELGVVDADVFEAMRLASGKRAESTLLAIGTPPSDPDSIMRTLVEHGREGDDPTFALVEYRAPDGCAVDDRDAWHQANPALGDFLYVGRDGDRGPHGPGVVVPAVPAGPVADRAGGRMDGSRAMGVEGTARFGRRRRCRRGARPRRVLLAGQHRAGGVRRLGSWCRIGTEDVPGVTALSCGTDRRTAAYWLRRDLRAGHNSVVPHRSLTASRLVAAESTLPCTSAGVVDPHSTPPRSS